MILPDTDLTNERLGNYINHIVEVAFNAGLECDPEATNKYESLNETKNKVLKLTENVSLMRLLKMNNFKIPSKKTHETALIELKHDTCPFTHGECPVVPPTMDTCKQCIKTYFEIFR